MSVSWIAYYISTALWLLTVYVLLKRIRWHQEYLKEINTEVDKLSTLVHELVKKKEE